MLKHIYMLKETQAVPGHLLWPMYLHTPGVCGKESADLQTVLNKTEGFNKSFKTGANAGDQAL